jgi:hypothetical protein
MRPVRWSWSAAEWLSRDRAPWRVARGPGGLAAIVPIQAGSRPAPPVGLAVFTPAHPGWMDLREDSAFGHGDGAPPRYDLTGRV